MHEALHPREDVDRHYVSRKGTGRGLTSADATIQQRED